MRFLCWLCAAASGIWGSFGLAADGPANPFFVLQNGVIDENHQTLEAQAALLYELGYQGMGPSGTKGIPALLEAFDKKGLKIYAQYIGANVDANKEKYDPGLPEAIEQLAGRETFIWLYVQGAEFPRGSREGDARAVSIVGEVGEMAARHKLRVALYPHAGFYIESVEDALRIADQVGRDNVGVTFNLCHYLRVGSRLPIEDLIKKAMPRLFVVTINGADAVDKPGAGWDRLIQPLGQGTYDVAGFVRTLQRLGYRGPIGLQCYAVPGDKPENLKKSMAAWKAMVPDR